MSRIKTVIFTLILSFCFYLPYAAAEEPLAWKDCVKEAAKNHPDLIAAEEAVNQSKAAKTITASTLYPQIDTSLNASTARTSSASGPATTSNNYNYGASASQLLFDGLKTVNNVKAASENIKAAQYNYRFTSTEIRLRLRSAFLNLLNAQESIKINKDIFDIRRSDLELITLRYESGMEHKGALLNSEANLAQAEFQINQAKRAREVAQRQLIKEMGRTQFSDISVKSDFALVENTTQLPDFDGLADKNPNLGKFIAQKNAAAFGIKSAEADFFPHLSGQAQANKNGSHWPPRGDEYNAGLSLTFPLFEGGLRFAQVSSAKAQFNQAKENERSTKDTIIFTLEQTWAALHDAIETVAVQKKFLSAAEERYRIAEAQYSLGLLQYDNWTIIEDTLVRTKTSVLDAETQALQAEANWIQAKGETLEYAQ
ncbi:MAG: TolC family protein [Candidatus Omnitrophica bacterium]|nr:TolC family protein [Candidatus Omnitrophota bacterium]